MTNERTERMGKDELLADFEAMLEGHPKKEPAYTQIVSILEEYSRNFWYEVKPDTPADADGSKNDFCNVDELVEGLNTLRGWLHQKGETCLFEIVKKTQSILRQNDKPNPDMEITDDFLWQIIQIVLNNQRKVDVSKWDDPDAKPFMSTDLTPIYKELRELLLQHNPIYKRRERK